MNLRIVLTSIIVLLSSLLLPSCLPVTGQTDSHVDTLVISPTATPEPTPTAQPPAIWVDPDISAVISNQVHFPQTYGLASDPSRALFKFSQIERPTSIVMVYLIASPFYNLRDEITTLELQKIWIGRNRDYRLYVNPNTLHIFTQKWGKPGLTVKVVDSTAAIDLKVDDSASLVLFPFEEIQPHWKILQVDGQTPFTHQFEAATYPLSIFFGFQDDFSLPADLQAITETHVSNYDPDLLSILVMTGTTALTRGTAHQMDVNGTTWPAKDIGAALREADITHISNEVSFYQHCSKGNPNERSLMFCSRPEYIDLLVDVGADVIELSGNHNMDYGRQPYQDSLEIYRQKGMKTYAGGLTEANAREALLLEDHGNKIAFLGCNFVGPTFAMATTNTMGAAHCDFDYFEDQIASLKALGYLPVFTFQYSEYTIHKPGEHQERDFKRMADAGAVIVSGSQAHYPQVMHLYNSSFLHYGLGNLFFDQMDIPVVGTREEFIDRHYFYNCRYIGTDLITALLEDAARPRPMTDEERADFLSRIFADALPKPKPTPIP